MSFDLFVYASHLPENLSERLIAELAEMGLHCELQPGIDLAKWPGGFVNVCLRVAADAFPNAERYGSGPLHTGFDLFPGDIPPGGLDEVIASLAAPQQDRLRQAHKQLMLQGGHTIAGFRLQWMPAISLAKIVQGVLGDPQSGRIFLPEEARQLAEEQARRWETSPPDAPSWKTPPFPGWSAIEQQERERAERIRQRREAREARRRGDPANG